MDKSKPQIAVFGPDFNTAYRNNSVSYLRAIIKYMSRTGYRINYYQPDFYLEYPQAENLTKNPQIRIMHYTTERFSLERAIASAANADIIIKVSGLGKFDDWMEERLLQIKNHRQKIIFWDIDAPATLHRAINDLGSGFRLRIPKFDHIFIKDGGQNACRNYKMLGADNCMLIHAGFDPEIHFKVRASLDLEADLAFLGNSMPGIDEKMKEYFIKVAQRMPDKKFLLAGMGWNKFDMSSNIRYIGHLPLKYHNVLYSSAGAVLNISRDGDEDYYHSPASGVFEAAAAGACIISDDYDGIESFFEPMKELWIAENGRQLENLLNTLTKNRMTLTGAAARMKVLEKHSYARRVEQIDKLLHKERIAVPAGENLKVKKRQKRPLKQLLSLF